MLALPFTRERFPRLETNSGGPTRISLFCPTEGVRVLGKGSYSKTSDHIYGSHDGSGGKKTVSDSQIRTGIQNDFTLAARWDGLARITAAIS